MGWLAAPEIALDLAYATAAIDAPPALSAAPVLAARLVRLVEGLRALGGYRVITPAEFQPTRRRSFCGRLSVLARGEIRTSSPAMT